MESRLVYHVTSCHVMSCHVVSNRIVSYRAAASAGCHDQPRSTRQEARNGIITRCRHHQLGHSALPEWIWKQFCFGGQARGAAGGEVGLAPFCLEMMEWCWWWCYYYYHHHHPHHHYFCCCYVSPSDSRAARCFLHHVSHALPVAHLACLIDGVLHTLNSLLIALQSCCCWLCSVLCAGSKQPPEMPIRLVCRAAVRHRVHLASPQEPAHLALPDLALCHPPPVRSLGF